MTFVACRQHFRACLSVVFRSQQHGHHACRRCPVTPSKCPHLPKVWPPQALRAFAASAPDLGEHGPRRSVKTVRGLDAVSLYADNIYFGPYGSDDIALYGFEDVRGTDTSLQKHKVAEIQSDGRVTVMECDATDLKLAARDIPMFSPSSTKVGQRATIAIREGRILVRTELVRAIISRNSAILFECRRTAHTERMGLAVHQRVVALSSVPFELRVLEGLLDQTMDYLENKLAQIRMLNRVIQEDISAKLSSSDIRRLLPLQKAITALQYDIKETQEAIGEVTKNDRHLASLCLSEEQNPSHQGKSGGGKEWTPHMVLASRILTAYDRRIKALDSDVRELNAHIDSTREVWHMQLDANRNTIIRLNLHLSFASIAAMVATAPAAFYGMNVDLSGLEEDPDAFWHIVEYSTLSGVVVLAALVVYFRLWPARYTQQRIVDMTALHDLLAYHVDEMDEVVEAAKLACHAKTRISHQDFVEIVDHALGDESQRTMSTAEIGLLYRVLDTNSDGWIDLHELYRVRSQITVASSNSEGVMETPASSPLF